MRIKVNRLKRLVFAAMAVAVTATATLPSFMGHASAANLATDRYVKMSSSSNTASSVSYEIGFTTATTGNLRGIVVDFCADSPIVNYGTCTTPTGFSVGTPTATVSSSFTAAGSWTAGQLNSNRTLYVTNNTNTSIASGTAGTVTVTTVTNPTSAPATFYARIYTYDSAAGATGYTVANTQNGGGTQFDYGGVALATAAQITVTAKVQESLTFCVYTTSCGVGTAVTLGDGNGVLASTTTNYTSTSSYDLGSNANSGVVVRLKGDTLKAGSLALTSSGTTCTADSAVAGTEQYGLRLSTVGSGQSATAPYNCLANNHALDITSACTNGDDNLTCTYGDRIASTSGPTASSTSVVEYMAKASTTTKPGVYAATYSYIATGTY